MPDPEIDALRAALAVSPDNAPLRRHLSRVLVTRGLWADAETELRWLLRQAPAEGELHFELAKAFHAQGKNSEAIALLEARADADLAAAGELTLFAKVLLATGDKERARAVYERAVRADPSAADPSVGLQLAAVVRSDEEPSGEEMQREDAVEVERPKVTFADVGGMATVKEEIRMKIVLPLQHPEMFRAYGKTAGGGVLMYGPPGCGKTYIARATAGEVKAGFVAVGISDILDMWTGESERKLHETFERARRNRPCVLFFDEVDALGAQRSDLRFSGARHVVNQFLEELDGVRSSNEGVLVLAATNAPWHVDSAFRRPGRFDRVVFVAPPDAPAREEILRAQLAGKPQEEVQLGSIAAKTQGWSGADLKGLVDRAVEGKLREALRTGRPSPIRTMDLEKAAAGGGATTREWFATAKNYALHANQAGIYDDILKYLKLG
ncbi:MAG: ATP-dependent zinc metalloprotease FtsH [Planctomycetes bacterium]|nr:ATP-dependent zinc metalloprotease FtsH [Planctomycetota bacterium]